MTSRVVACAATASEREPGAPRRVTCDIYIFSQRSTARSRNAARRVVRKAWISNQRGVWSPLPLFSKGRVNTSTPRARKASSQHCEDFAKYLCRSTHRFILVSICSLSVGMNRPQRRVTERGRRLRVDDRVKAKRKRPEKWTSGAFWTSFVVFRPFFLVADDSRRLWGRTRIVRV